MNRSCICPSLRAYGAAATCTRPKMGARPDAPAIQADSPDNLNPPPKQKGLLFFDNPNKFEGWKVKT